MSLALAPMPSPYGVVWSSIAAYLLGSIPFGKLLLADRYADRSGPAIRLPRNSHSSAETEIVSRRGNGLAARPLAILLDAAKGYLAVWLASHVSQANIHWMMIAGLSAILGDIAPIWLRFRGGRGVATGAGTFLAICWPAVALAFSLWLVVLWFWDYLSLASISAAAALPMLIYVLYAPGHAPPEIVSFNTMFAAVLVIMGYKTNIQRLLAGTEPRFRMGRLKNDSNG